MLQSRTGNFDFYQNYFVSLSSANTLLRQDTIHNYECLYNYCRDRQNCYSPFKVIVTMIL